MAAWIGACSIPDVNESGELVYERAALVADFPAVTPFRIRQGVAVLWRAFLAERNPERIPEAIRESHRAIALLKPTEPASASLAAMPVRRRNAGLD